MSKSNTDLPAAVVARLKRHLTAYSEAQVTFKPSATKPANVANYQIYIEGEGVYAIGASICLSNSRNDAISSLGWFEARDLLTEAQRIIGYVRQFRDYPYRAGKDHLTYRGHKDYRQILSNWTDVKFDDNSNLIFTNPSKFETEEQRKEFFQDW